MTCRHDNGARAGVGASRGRAVESRRLWLWAAACGRLRLRGAVLLAAPLLLALAGSASAPATAGAQVPEWGPPLIIDGPSSDITALSGIAIAHDGTGGVVYLKNVNGVAHVFVSRLVGGVFQGPEQVDGSLSGPSSQPVIGAGNGGLLLVAFINGGALYVVDRASAQAPYGAPQDLSDGASNPAIQTTYLSKAYLAFTVADGDGHDVRAAFYDNGSWGVEPTPLNAIAADDAGTGLARPAVAAAGDGVGIVAWGEGGHIYSRRVWGTSPSVVYEQADIASLSGWSEISADQPAVATGGDSSYADVTFQETFANSTASQDRVLVNRLHGSVYDGAVGADGLSTPGSDGADQPQDSAGDYGIGFSLTERENSNQLWATVFGQNGTPGVAFQADSQQNSAPPYATSAIDGLFTGLIAWQETPPLGTPEIRIRYYNGSTLQPEVVISSPSQGPTDAADGLVTGGDIGGDAALAWVQGTGSSRQIVADLLYQGPGAIATASGFQYARTTRPALVWSVSNEAWGPVQYVLTLDGVEAVQSAATSFVPPVPLSQGPHTWQVTATNPAGLTTSTRTATVFVDTVPPTVTVSLTGKLRAGSVVHAYVAYTDAPAPLLPADASGIASVTIKWGDGTSYSITHGKFHVYKRAGRYLLSAIVTDQAGNTTTITRLVKIVPKPKPKPKRKKKSKPTKKHALDGGSGPAGSAATANAPI